MRFCDESLREFLDNILGPRESREATDGHDLEAGYRKGWADAEDAFLEKLEEQLGNVEETIGYVKIAMKWKGGV
jgi:hypothetical protein